ncbi:MAG: ATP-binding protein [Alphaproteobacteria bacterium]
MKHAPGGGGNPLPMTVHKVGFLLDRLGQDCSPLQYLRELTQNAIEAVQRNGAPGQVIWDVDWISYDLGGGPMKLCVVDTGDGMTGDEMIRLINQLSSSGSQQSITGNYGVGAKIAAATKSPAGVIYQSWKNGEGSMVQLEKNAATGEYGLRQWELKDGTYSHHVPLDEAVRPAEIGAHGTKVILLGMKSSDNTIAPPADAASPSRWISKYLNTRYFEFPAGFTIKAREGWDSPRTDKDRNLLRTITGQKPYLDQHAIASGTEQLSNARAHWWILKDEPAISNNSGFIESAGHVAALYQNELYDRATARAGTALLQRFGILFGYRFVVLYVEPVSEKDETLTTNTARTTLLLSGEKLPWEEWAYEFREKMPKKLADFVNEKAAALTEKDYVSTIRERLKTLMDLYKVTRYRPAPAGVYLSDQSSSVRIGRSQLSALKSDGGSGNSRDAKTSGGGQRDGEVGNIYHLFEKKGGVLSDKSASDPFPIVKWVSTENDTRTADDGMEDKAATFLPAQNTLLINADFRVFKDMIVRLCKEKDMAGGLGVQSVVDEVVHQWFEQALIETVLGIQQLKGSKEWAQDEIDKALSPEALTSAVMQRYHVYIACRRDLGAKFGKFAASS